jgi:hypothetical protein
MFKGIGTFFDISKIKEMGALNTIFHLWISLGF